MSDSILKSFQDTILFEWNEDEKVFCVFEDGEFFDRTLTDGELAQLGQELIDLANSKGKK
jgi:hypothetical protein